MNKPSTPAVPTKRRNRTPTPVASYGPELLAALVKGSGARFEVRMPYADATRFRQRIHQLRNSMRETTHELYNTVSRTKVTIVWGLKAGFEDEPFDSSYRNVTWPRNPDAPALVIIQPYDAEFSKALSEAGLTHAELTDDPLRATEPSEQPESSEPVNPSSGLEEILNIGKEPK